MTLLPKISPRNSDDRRAQTYRACMRQAATMGGQLFGPVPTGHRREFFCLDRHTWVWHEEWTDAKGNHAVTTRYDIRPQGILKSQGTQSYQLVKGPELQNLYQAARLYCDNLQTHLGRIQQLA